MPYQHVHLATCAMRHCKGSCMLVKNCHRLATVAQSRILLQIRAEPSSPTAARSHLDAGNPLTSMSPMLIPNATYHIVHACMIMRAFNVLVAKTLQLNMFVCTCTVEHASVEFFYSLVTLVPRAVTFLVVIRYQKVFSNKTKVLKMQHNPCWLPWQPTGGGASLG